MTKTGDSDNHIGVDFGGSPVARPPKIGTHPCIYQFLPHLVPQNLCFPHPNIFYKSTPVVITLKLDDFGDVGDSDNDRQDAPRPPIGQCCL